MGFLHCILFGFSISIIFAHEEIGHIELGCPTGSYRHGNVCYAVGDNDEVTYEEAKRRCNYNGGSLATIKDYETHVFLHRLRMRKFLHCYWFGMHDFLGEGSWIYEDGTHPFHYTNWDDGEPNNNGGIQDCASLLMHKDLKWDDEYCFMKFLYVCEFPDHQCTSKSNILGKTCYEPSHDFASYNGAKSKCIARGGQLALIKSEQIDAFIRKTIYNDMFWLTMDENQIMDVYAGLALKFTWIKGSWIDLQYTNGEWKYGDNTTLIFTRWSDQYYSPFHCATLGKRMDPNECEIYYSYGKTNYRHDDIQTCYDFAERWNKAQCSEKNSYICQYPPGQLLEHNALNGINLGIAPFDIFILFCCALFGIILNY